MIRICLDNLSFCETPTPSPSVAAAYPSACDRLRAVFVALTGHYCRCRFSFPENASSVAATGKMGDDLEVVVFRDRVNLRGLGDYYRETEECDHH